MPDKKEKKYSDLWYGWTGKKRYISDFARSCERAFYTVSEYIGVLILTLVATQIRWIFGNDFSLDFIKNITFKDIIHYSLGLIGLILLGYGRVHKGKDFKNLILEKEALQESVEKSSTTNEELSKKARIFNEELVKSKQNYSDLYSKFLRNWLKASMYALSMDKPNYRVTIYAYTDGKFLYVSRYSKNTLYNELHSIDFSPNEGVISQAWRLGEHIDINNCPNYQKDKEGYLAYIKDKYGYTDEKINSLTMKSCQYVAFTVNDEGGPIAIIVFENDCKVENRITTQKVTQILSYCSIHNSQIVSYIREGIKCNTLGNKKSTQGQNQVKETEKELLVAFEKKKGGE